ncbi:hypothetical protein WA026_015275 [Henosepilachna vigintioctopunctata]|uniref:Uncharacterized protein n=1 Tax=Henosepilachna vigintioctopunctata TaxID=420089 RepID=A0AAW1TWE6_9CUCU
MKCVTIFLPIIVITFLQYFAYGNPKCCDNGHQMKALNSTWTCQSNSNKRLQSNFQINSFITRNTNGTCVETVFQNQTSKFFVDENKNVSKKDSIEFNFFPKCCHLGRSYNQKLHSCVQMENSSAIEKFIPRDSYISIGLPNCKIISDVEQPSLESFSFPSDFIYLSKEKKNISKGNFCVDSTLDSKFIVRICEKDYQVCDQVRCIHKCCFDGQSFVNGSKCRDTFRYGVDLKSTKYIEEPDCKYNLI